MTQRWVTLCLNLKELCDKFMYNGYRTSTIPHLVSVTLQGSFKLRSLHLAHTEPSTHLPPGQIALPDSFNKLLPLLVDGPFLHALSSSQKSSQLKVNLPISRQVSSRAKLHSQGDGLLQRKATQVNKLSPLQVV